MGYTVFVVIIVLSQPVVTVRTKLFGRERFLEADGNTWVKLVV